MSGTSPPKPPSVWKFFDKTPDHGICHICGAALSRKNGTTGAMLNHLKMHHDMPEVADFIATRQRHREMFEVQQSTDAAAAGQREVEENSPIFLDENRHGVWQFFLQSQDKTLAKCELCCIVLKLLDGSIGCLNKHLKTHEDDEKVAGFLASKRKRYNEPDCDEEPPTFVDLNKTNIWRFFLRSSDKTLANCIFCYSNLKIIRGSTGSMHNHLKIHQDREEVVQFLASRTTQGPRTAAVVVKREKVVEAAADGDEEAMEYVNRYTGKNPVWKFFLQSKDKTISKCVICHIKLRTKNSATGSMHNHLNLHRDNEDVAEFIEWKRNPLGTEMPFWNADEESAETEFVSCNNRSGVWNFFVQSADKTAANCMICFADLKVIRGSTGSMHNHLNVHRDNEDVAEFLKEKKKRAGMGNSRGEEYSDTAAAYDDDAGGGGGGYYDEGPTDRSTQSEILEALKRIEGTLAVHTELLGELMQRRENLDTDSAWKKRRRSF